MSANGSLISQVLPSLGIALSLLLAGCGGDSGPRRVTVSGSVEVDGKAMESGTIRFLPSGDNRGAACAGVIQGGGYRLSGDSGPIAGIYRVQIVMSPSPSGGKLAGTPSAELPRSEWHQSVTVPDQSSYQHDMKLSVSDPVVP